MRIALTLDADVASMLARLQEEKDMTFTQLANEALRQGLQRIAQPVDRARNFHTEPASLGKCRFPNLDNTWEVLSEAEGESFK